MSFPPRTTPRTATTSLLLLAHSFRASVICSVSNPFLKPAKKPAPTDCPSFIDSLTSIPRSASSPILIPLPIPCPMLVALSIKYCFPVLFHHALNGSATILSHAILSFPQMSAFAQSSPLVNSSMVVRSQFIFSSTKSITSPMAFSIAGILPVIHVANCRRYGASLAPREIFTPSMALFSRVNEPARLSSMTSAICSAVPWLFSIDSARLLKPSSVAFIMASMPLMA